MICDVNICLISYFVRSRARSSPSLHSLALEALMAVVRVTVEGPLPCWRGTVSNGYPRMCVCVSLMSLYDTICEMRFHNYVYTNIYIYMYVDV